MEPLKKQVRDLEDEVETLKQELGELQRDYAEQEQTLVDLGAHISESKLKLSDMETKNKALRDKGWADDKSVTECQGCSKVFNVTRR